MGRRALVGAATTVVADALRDRMDQRDLTLDQVAESSGLSRSTVHRAISGESALSVEVLIPLCRALGLDAGVLLTRADRATRGRR